MQDDDIAAIMRALGHPVRLNILRILANQQRGECCCADVTDELTLAQSTVSQHIKVLLDAGLIPAGLLSPHKARLLLGLCIASGETRAGIAATFGAMN